MSEGGGARRGPSGLFSSFRWRTGAEDRDVRLDLAVSAFVRVPPEQAKALVEFGSVRVDGRAERDPARLLSGGEEISVHFPARGTDTFYEIDPARVLFRDRFLLAYDKEAGIPSQQTPSDAQNNLFAALLRHLAREGAAGAYAALHHRLDRETSGVMLFAVDRRANRGLGEAFRKGLVGKEYLAWVEGRPQEQTWTGDSEIGKRGSKYVAVPRGEGREAQTRFWVLYGERDRCLVLARPLTGRTHQIRIHLAEAGCPVLGDRLYGAKPQKRLYLHALRLTLRHPVLGTSLVLEAPVPPDWTIPRGVPFPQGSPA